MAEPRKVPFVTLSAFTAAAAAPPPPGSEARKRRLDADTELSLSRESGLGAPEADGSGKAPGQSETVRINITLPESTELSFPEFSYSELLQAKKNPPAVTQTCNLFNDEQREKQEVEALARKYENKYGSGCRRKRKDRVQDLIDIGFGYDESDSFIDNSEAYDELVPASLTTKLGGFYINTGTLQFRTASESESDDVERRDSSRGDEDSEVKKKRRRDEEELEEKKMTNNRLTKTGVSRPEKKRRKKLMLAAMLRRFAREKKETSKLNPTNSAQLLHSDALLGDLTSDPAMMSLLTSASEGELQDLLNDLDFSALDSAPQTQLTENGPMFRTEIACPPPLPEGLPAPLVKRIEDLRAASRQFDEEGRKKFFTLDMNNILLDIELQVQEQSPSIRSAVYSHLEAFVPCNKEALLKRLKKLSLNIQDDRLRTPLLKLKLAVCSVMPEQTARYHMDCMAKVAAKQHMEDGERNASEDEEEEKPGKRVMGPRKKFIWDDKLRTLLCNLVRVKLRCYEQEKSSLSVEDYLKAFMETEVKPLWPKGWMQARMLFKESLSVHAHLTDLGKKRIISTPRPAKIKEMAWQLGAVPGVNPTPFSTHPPSEPICLSDSLDEDLATNSLDSIAQALTLLNNSANGVNPNTAPSTSSSSPVIAKPHTHTVSPTPSSQSSTSKDVSSVQRQTVTPASRPINASMNTMPTAKPRPPPTTTPLQKPFAAIGMKSSQATPPAAQMKTPSNKLCDSGTQQPSLNSVSFQQLTTPPSRSSPLPQKKATPARHHQQRFITPMQATITKSSQSSNSPIIKLTHRPPAQTTPSGSAHRPPAQTTPSGSAHRLPAQTTPSGSAHRLPAQTTPSGSAHRLPAQTTPSGSAHRLPPQTTPSGSAHRLPAQTTPSASAHRLPAQTTPSASAHRPPVQTTPSGSAHRPPVHTTLSGSAHRTSAQTTPSGSSHRSPFQTTAAGSIHHPPTQTTPSASAHRPPAQSTLPGSAHRPPVQTTPPGPTHQPPGSAHRSSVSTPSPPSPAQHPTITTPSSGNRPPASNPQNLAPAHRSPASTLPSSGSTHRPSVSTPPSPSSQRPSVQTPPGSAYRQSVPTPPPIIVHRSPVTTPPSVSSPSPSSSRTSVPTPPTQYSPKSSGFKPPFSPGPVVTPHTSSFQDCNLTSSSVTTNHGQRQRAVGGGSQSNKSSANCASAMGLPSLSDSALLNQVASVPLGLGMFGGLVPVSLPFQFPLLNFTPPGAATHTPNSGYTLTPNLFKSLQSGVQAALPPHLQLAFSESNQSQGGDVKRK
ncbi:ubinuclein-2a isoform X1 [Ictalurus punctatus]|uniref:Ubinuclein-2a isoform X1 n=1 Tax=Ictalurus punctatus TaxID=7998 RepID=A0A2D0S139_ICTPU|nr:ubinuclein-2a isoform X1 [Ictalurus punctatus]XP_017336470.2 ubinuclein-2a isoform X1 [Ictalurus punctatus]